MHESQCSVYVFSNLTIKTYFIAYNNVCYRDTKPKYDPDKDPNEGIMDLMRKMYNEGDDDMKRTIAKAWTESQERRATGSDGF